MSRDPARAQVLFDHGCLDRSSACTDKVRYQTRTEALGGCKARWRRSERQHVPYHCPFCDGYHITRIPYGEDA